jgi:hypothetical protein
MVPSNEEDRILDAKVIKRLRMLQMVAICLSLGAIGLIVGGVFGFSNKWSDETLLVKGWHAVGADVVGPTDQPLTLFGSSLALSGDGTRMAIVAPGIDDGSSFNTGAVYMFEGGESETGASWTVLDIVSGPGGSVEPQVAVAMSLDSTWLAVGYPHLTTGSRVHVYHEQDGKWNLTTVPLVSPKSAGSTSSWFGYAVDMSADGGILAVGAPVMDSPFGIKSGTVQVYQFREETNAWVQMGSELVGSASDEYFGWSVSLSSDGGRLSVGAPVADDTTGLVRIFDWNGVAWIQVGKDKTGEIPLNRFGESVSLSSDGQVLAVGARGSAFEPGQAHIFREIDGEWVADSERAALVGTEAGEGFGSSVALSTDGSVLIVGSPQNNRFGEGTGAMSVFRHDAATKSWKPEGSAIGSAHSAGLGTAVALSLNGTRVAGGAPTTAYDGSIPRAGIVLVYDRNTNNTA